MTSPTPLLSYDPDNKTFTNESLSKPKYLSPNSAPTKHQVTPNQQDFFKSTLTPSTTDLEIKHTKQLPIYNFDSSENESDTLNETQQQ